MGRQGDTQENTRRRLQTLQARVRELEEAERMRELAEEECRDSERRHRAIIETQTDFISRHRDGGVLTFVNDALCRYVGKQREELIGRTFLDFLPEEARTQVVNLLASLTPQNPEGMTEHRVVLPNGETRWQQWENHAIFDDEGRLIEYQSVGRDLTDQRQAEATLWDAKRRVDHLLRSCPAVVYSCGPGPEYPTTFISENVVSLLGYEAQRFLDDRHFWEKHVHPDDLDRVLCELSRVEHGMPFSSEYRIRRADGEYIWLHDQLNPARTSNGSAAEYLGSWFDVTERKRTDERLRLLSSAVEQSTEGVAVADLDGNLLFVNRSFASMHGYTPEELDGAHLSIFHSAEQMKSVDAANRKIKERGSFSGEIWHKRRDGTVFPAMMHNSLFRDERGAPVGMIATMHDITALKETEEVRARLESQLRQVHQLQAVGQLAAGVAHDFNSVLTIVLGNAELLQSELKKRKLHDQGDVSIGALKQVVEAAERGQTLVQKLLTFGRARSWRAQAIDLNERVEHVCRMLEGVFGKHIKLKVSKAPDLKAIHADAGQIEQVLMNLLLNAHDAMTNGGELAIETANVDLDEPHVAAHVDAQPGAHVVLTIRDTGAGMDGPTLERLFEPFFTTKPIDKGTGLGLSIVYGIIKRAGGHITVDSEVKKGTTFKIYFPAVE